MNPLCSECWQNQETLKIWMIHLANSHPLPSEWLSEKAKMLNDDENRKPYTVVTDSRKRRRRPTTPRPLNTFMIFSRHIRRNILTVFPDASNSQLSKDLGLIWKRIGADVKTHYEEEAKRLARLHQQEFPDYKYQPKKRAAAAAARRQQQQHLHQQHHPHQSQTPHWVEPAGTSSPRSSLEEEARGGSGGGGASDVENHYIRYSVTGKNCVKRECQTFGSGLSPPSSTGQHQIQQQQQPPFTVLKREHTSVPSSSGLILKPLNVRITNVTDSGIFIRPSKLLTSAAASSNIYLISSSGGHVASSHSLFQQQHRPQQHQPQMPVLTPSPYEEELSNHSQSAKDLCLINSTFPDHSLDEEIDITGNLFNSELEMDWNELEMDRHDLPTLNSLFNH